MPEPDPVILPIEDALDLHAFAPRDVRSVVDEYLRQAAARGFREVRLIHGQGTEPSGRSSAACSPGIPRVERFFDGAARAGRLGRDGGGAEGASPGRRAAAASGR